MSDLSDLPTKSHRMLSINRLSNERELFFFYFSFYYMQKETLYLSVGQAVPGVVCLHLSQENDFT